MEFRIIRIYNTREPVVLKTKLEEQQLITRSRWIKTYRYLIELQKNMWKSNIDLKKLKIE